jgi:signal transduction histidine kinase
VPSVKTPSVLAEAADVLSDQLKTYLRKLAVALRPSVDRLERRFLNRLATLGYSPAQSAALARLTPGSAAKLLARGRGLSEFLEEVAYNGRRLAKLHLAPAGVTSALSEYDQLLAPLFAGYGAQDLGNFQWARQQLQFCVMLTLNNAYYEVRERETEAFYEMFRAELESAGLDELLSRFLVILREFCRSDAAALAMTSGGEGGWTRLVRMEGGGAPRVLTAGGIAQPAWNTTALSRARLFAGKPAARYAVDPDWGDRFVSIWSAPMRSGGGIAGVLQFGFSRPYRWLPREEELLTAAAERCLRAAEKAWLVERLAARQEQVRELAGRMLLVEERERRRVSRELHDQTGQDMLCMRLKLELLEHALPPGDARERVAEVRDLCERTIVEVRRLIGALSPAVLEQLGLAAALRQLVNRMREMHPCRVRLQTGRLGVVPKNMEMIVYRLIQECTSNIVKHSRANHVNIQVGSADGYLRLCVEDDGVGFAVEDVLNRRNAFGLAGIRERVALLGGRLEIDSRLTSWPRRPKRTGKGGTRVRVELPVRPEADGAGGTAIPA